MVHGFQLEAQLFDGPGALGKLLGGGSALHGQHRAAYLHIGGGELQQNVQPCHGPAGGVVEGFPAGGHGLLCPGGDALGADAQLGQNLLQPLHPLAQRIQQGDLGLGTGDGQRHTGEARSAAHVDEALALQVGAFEDGQGVGQVESCGLAGIGDGGEVHHLVLLQHGLAEGTQAVGCLRPDAQVKLGQGFQKGSFHHGHHPMAPTMPLRST